MGSSLFFLVEEKSIKPIIDAVMRKMVGKESTRFLSHKVITHDGKHDLRKQIPKVSRGIAKMPGASIIIVHDQDEDDCMKLKGELVKMVGELKSRVSFKVRIVCRELENWYLGDLDALGSAYPRFKPKQYRDKEKFRVPDAIHNAKAELIKIVPELGGKRTLPKLRVAEEISPHLSIEDNISSSFKQFVLAISTLPTATRGR